MSNISRRQWVKGMALASLGTLAFHSNAHANPIALALSEEQTLHLLMGTIIPESSIPGAIRLGVPTFVRTMLQDCYEKPAQDQMKTVLGNVPSWFQDGFKKSIDQATEAEKEQFVFQMEKGKFGDVATKSISTLKALTIQGYMSTEYVMTEHLHYQMAPGFWNPCVPVKK